ncbi:thiamine pyrophosphate-binding protein [Micrococcales bacterium 31B]|nr:thiamine pyrophosphate-binding protein [Micrococcales bacterium 31B]
MPTVTHHVAHALSQHVEHVFGLMGNGNAHFLDALLRETDVAFTAVRHEAGAVVAADAYFRVSGKIAAASTTYGAGFTNTLTALAESAQARVPLVLIVGDEPTSGPRSWDVDQIALASAVGARTYTVGRLDAAATTVIAIEHALSYRVPVVLAIPYDMPKRDAGELPQLADLQLPQPAPLSVYQQTAITRVAKALAAAERPVMLAGRGAHLSGAGAELGALATHTGALTASSALARGIFPETQYDLGITGGFGAEGAMELIHSADVALVFGASLNQFTMRFGGLFGPDTLVVQIDAAPNATNARVNEFLQGDARTIAAALVEALRAEQPDATSPGWREGVDLASARVYEAGDDLAPDGRLDPRSAAVKIGELLPEDRVVVSDGGHFIGWANMYWPVKEPGRMVMVGTAYQSIGLGFPSVPGAAAAAPDSTIVLTTGDGGGLMAIADLESAVRTAGGRGICVVWNDGAYSAEVNLYGLQGLVKDPMLIPVVDFAAMGAAVGAEGHVIRTLADLDVLREWAAKPVAERQYLLLDLRVSGDVIAPYQHEIIAINSGK